MTALVRISAVQDPTNRIASCRMVANAGAARFSSVVVANSCLVILVISPQRLASPQIEADPFKCSVTRASSGC
jgi:hypothetical protein